MFFSQSSGSGSENDSETQISVKSKTSVKSDNKSGSNDRDYYGSTDLKVDDESDNGSDGQVLRFTWISK